MRCSAVMLPSVAPDYHSGVKQFQCQYEPSFTQRPKHMWKNVLSSGLKNIMLDEATKFSRRISRTVPLGVNVMNLSRIHIELTHFSYRPVLFFFFINLVIRLAGHIRRRQAKQRISDLRYVNTREPSGNFAQTPQVVLHFGK